MTLRLFWFLVGAGSATLWMKHHEAHKLDKKDRLHECPANQPSVSLDEWQRWAWSHRWDWSHRWEWPKSQSDWEDDRAKMVALSRQATDTVGEVSEAALDTLLSTATALKTKLAEARAQREQEHKRAEEQRKQQPTRWA